MLCEEDINRCSLLKAHATIVRAQSASKHHLTSLPNLAFAEGCKRIGWDRRQYQIEVNRTGLILKVVSAFAKKKQLVGAKRRGGSPFPATLLATV